MVLDQIQAQLARVIQRLHQTTHELFNSLVAMRQEVNPRALPGFVQRMITRHGLQFASLSDAVCRVLLADDPLLSHPRRFRIGLYVAQ